MIITIPHSPFPGHFERLANGTRFAFLKMLPPHIWHIYKAAHAYPQPQALEKQLACQWKTVGRFWLLLMSVFLAFNVQAQTRKEILAQINDYKLRMLFSASYELTTDNLKNTINGYFEINDFVLTSESDSQLTYSKTIPMTCYFILGHQRNPLNDSHYYHHKDKRYYTCHRNVSITILIDSVKSGKAINIMPPVSEDAHMTPNGIGKPIRI